MKTKLTLTLAAIAALLTTTTMAGPGFVDRAPAKAPRATAPGHVHKTLCKTMTIANNPKAITPAVVACDTFAKVRAAECRLACM